MNKIDMELVGKSVKEGMELLKKQPKVSLEEMLAQIQKSLHPGAINK